MMGRRTSLPRRPALGKPVRDEDYLFHPGHNPGQPPAFL